MVGTRRSIAGLVSAVTLSLAVPALAASDHSLGEGSSADNERLLPGIYPEAPVLASGHDVPEPPHPPLAVDWSLGLRGTYTNATGGERFDTRLLPSVSLEHLGTRSRVDFDANAEVIRPSNGGNIDVGALRLNLETEYALDSATRITADGNLSVTRDTPGTPGLASNVAVTPQTLSAGAAVGLTRDFGRFSVSVTGAAQRNLYGPTTLVDGTASENWGQNYWALDSALRVGFRATPIFEVFGQAGIGRDIADHPSSVLGVTTNANDYSIKGGLTGRWNTLEATGSAGLALRRFDEASLGQVVTQLYDAQLVFTPDPTWRMLAGFATTVAPPGPNGSGTTRVDYTARAEVGYTVNSWLALRAVADWNRARFEGSSNVETGYGYGVGADYKVNAHTDLSTDYEFDHNDSTSNGVQDAHRVTMGITVSR